MSTPRRLQVVLNVTHGCNLACRYCYYAREMARNPSQMSLETAERALQWLSGGSAKIFDLYVHGGEPLLRRPDYYETLFALVRKHLADREVFAALQTNGTLLDEAFVRTYRSIRESGIQLGLGMSLDGPRAAHDAARTYKRDGRGSFDDVVRSIRMLGDNGIGLALLSVAPITTPGCASELYGFFKSFQNVHSLDILVPRADSFPEAAPGALSALMCTVFDDWFFDADARFDIRLLASIVHGLLAGRSTLCTLQNDCITSNVMLSIAPEGDVSFCDSFPEEKLGHIETDTADALTDRNGLGRRRLSTREKKRLEQCAFCKWYRLCNGGCPGNQPAGSYLKRHAFCDDYQRIFAHVQERLAAAGLRASDGLNEDNLNKLTNPSLARSLRQRREDGLVLS